MLELKNGYVPIEDATTPRTSFKVPFPESVNPQIGINLGGLNRLMQLGGISHLTVTGGIDGEITNFTPTIVGFDAQGNAYAGTKGEKTVVPPFTTSKEGADLNPNAMFKPHATTWINGVVCLNINEIRERIRREDRWPRSVYSPEAWAHYLNISLREGLRNIGVKHLLSGVSGDNWISSALMYSLMLGSVAFYSPLSLAELPLVILPSVMLNFKHYLTHRGGDNRYRWSLFYDSGPQPDRALVLEILSHRTTLARALSKT